jgi:ABC-2 type transport system ATP-binding protein
VPPTQPAVVVSGLGVRYGEVVAVDGLDLEARAGEVVALLGRNGAGKTSTVETLEGYRPGATGSVSVLGLDPRRPRDHARLSKRVGVMLQGGGVYPAMGPAEALRLFASYYDVPANPGDLVDRLGLAAVARTPWRRLSGGEQQRLSMALALVGRPEVVLLDEPTAGVDPQGRQSIRGEIAGLRAAGVCVILTTHELQEAERVADRVVIVDRGRVVAEGTPAELATGNGTAGEQIRFGAPSGLDVAALGAALSARVLEATPGEYVVDCAPDPATIAALAAWLAERDLRLADLRAGRQRLEDVFLALTSEGGGSPGGATGKGPGGLRGERRRRRR